MPIEVITTLGDDDRVTARVGECRCGAEVDLSDPMTNVCSECGRLYNGYGQELRPEDEWEEPGEDD